MNGQGDRRHPLGHGPLRWTGVRPSRPSRAAVLGVAAALVVALAPAGHPPVANAALPMTGFYLDSVAEDSMGTGVPELWPQVGWSVTHIDETGVVALSLTAFSQGFAAWKDIHLSAPAGQHLVAGSTYAGGVGLTGCSVPSASGFTVHELVTGAPAMPSLAITLWVRCNGEDPMFFGDLRYNSAVPLRAMLVDDLDVTFPGTPTGTTSETAFKITSAGSEALTVSSMAFSRANADFSVVSETCTAAPIQPGASCDVVARFTPRVGGTRWADLLITDDTARGSHASRLSGQGIAPTSGVTWGSTYRAGPAYTWTGGSALGRTVQSGAQRLHLAYATDRVGSRWAKDTGPYAGIYYVRSTSGSTWSAPKRLNPSTQHAARLGLAAAGSRVYVTWVSQRKLIRYSPTAPRVLYVRVNTAYGASTKWKSTVRLTSTTGRLDYPTIAASGYDAYIAFTDSVTGSVRIASTRDRGANWRKVSLGSTSLGTKDGKAGWPSVAVSGSTVAVAWVANGSGRVLMRVSVNRGSTWGPPEEVSPQSLGDISATVRGGRIAVAWTTGDEVVLRQRANGTWGDPLVIASLHPGADPEPYSPVVTLQDPGRVAVTWAEEVAGYPDRSDLRWAESPDGGTTWFAAQTLQAASSSSTRRLNDWASVVWPSAGTRYIVWNGWTANSDNGRLYLRKGTGTPVGPAMAASEWQPARDAPGIHVDRRMPSGDRR